MRYVSWFLIVIGVLLVGYGAFDYFTAQVAQRRAAEAWTTGDRGNPQITRGEDEHPLPEDASPPIRPYFDPYRPGEMVAKLKLPHFDTPLFVVEGTDEKELRKGPGHMPGTALPGVDGNCVIAGHRDTHFRALKSIRKGDHVEIETKYGNFRYQVRSTQIVSPTNVASLHPTREGVLHLVTCYPFEYIGHAPKRMVVEAVLLR
jgi:sortase A